MMSDSDVHLPSAGSTESCDASYPSSREEIYKKLQVRFSSTKEISTKSDKSGFSPAVFRSRLKQKDSR